VGVPKLSQLGLLQLWGPITPCENLRLRWGLRKSCSHCWDLSNGISHATCTQGIWGNSQLLVIGSQIANFTLDPSLGHNLCFKYPNGSCELILDIYVSRASNGTQKSLIQWVLTFEIALWRFGSPLGFELPKKGVHFWEFTWECGGSLFHTLPHSWEHEMWLPTFTLSPHLHKPLFWSWTQG
jgi:hypothetical protein